MSFALGNAVSTIVFACFASGLFVKSKFVVSEPDRSAALDAPAARNTTPQMIKVFHGCRLLALANASGFIFIPVSFPPRPSAPRTVVPGCVRCMLTPYEPIGIRRKLSTESQVNDFEGNHRRRGIHSDPGKTPREAHPRPGHRGGPSDHGHRGARRRLDAACRTRAGCRGDVALPPR